MKSKKLVFVAKYRVRNITYSQIFEANSWVEAEQMCEELGMYDLGVFITIIY